MVLSGSPILMGFLMTVLFLWGVMSLLFVWACLMAGGLRGLLLYQAIFPWLLVVILFGLILGLILI